ncbi:MAG TPA: PEP/pyruvate-binding domain-containing protein [Anaerolineaceae bacterium]|nr:PEP/pyruvate-binding domain-containing protein [Anaerolineaceae bacterium]
MPTMQVDQALADQLVDRAIQMCADLKFHGDKSQALQALQLGRCDVCGTVSQCLVRLVSEYLGQIDRTVKAVFQYEPEFISLRQGGDFPAHPAGINLVAWVERKSAALVALASTLENAFSESRRRIPCREAGSACYVLDIQMVEDRDVQDRRGLGMMVSNRFLRSAQTWGREEAAVPTTTQPGSSAAEGGQVLVSSFDPEFSPEPVLFEQALAIEKLPLGERQPYEHRLREIKVALIRRLISDHLAYINIAKEWFTTGDMAEIYRKKIGNGRIGGKAAGMLLASRILQETLDEPLRSSIRVPESFFLGSDMLYLFMAMNGLMHWNNQKYKTEEQIRSEYPGIRGQFLAGEFPPEALCELGAMLEQIGRKPVIVRSSSLLEDNFGTSFAGKYESIFLPNQGGPKENLIALTRAIARIYASTLRPDALLYRRSKGLQDYDERMAVLVQEVAGETYGRYYLPTGAGVAFSRNLFRWSPQIRKEDGFVRLVWGLGTRAVERVGNDYPRMVALSHPNLQPDDSPEAIRYYSQQNVDLIDLETNEFKSRPIHEVIRPETPALRYLAQIEEDGYFSTPRGRVLAADIPRLAITFDEFLRRTSFASGMSRILHTLETHYRVPVDLEFTVKVVEEEGARPKVQFSLLQCRPQSFIQESRALPHPRTIDRADVLFATSFMVPLGSVTGIRHVLFVAPEDYFQLKTQSARNELRATIAKLNAALAEKSFLCVGPGRWGTVNPDLGVFVSYSDIHRSAALVELSGKGVGPAPDPSLGTHFFQDLMEANIYPLAVCLDHADTIFNRDFFYQTPNVAADFLPDGCSAPACVRLLNVADFHPGDHLDLIMDDEQSRAVAYLAPDK